MKPHRHSVLVTDAGYKHTLGAVRALAKDGFVVDAIGSNKSVCRYSRSLRQIAYPQNRFCDAHVDEFIDFLEWSNYDALLPIGARSVCFAAKHRKRIQQHCGLPLPDAGVIEQCMHKGKTGELAAMLGINVGKMWTLLSQEDVRRVQRTAAFPLVIKKCHELDRRPVLYVASPEELPAAYDIWHAHKGEAAHPPLAQEFIDGDGCGFFALYQQGQLKRAFMHKRVREVPATGGASCCAESVFQADVLEQGKRLLDALAWHGVAMVEFKRERHSGQLFLMEINPKFWGSLDLAIAAGVDFPSLAARVAMNEPIKTSLEYQVGVRFHWPLGGGELLHVSERPTSILSVLRDCVDLRVRSNLRLADPLPAARSLLEDVRALRTERSAKAKQRAMP